MVVPLRQYMKQSVYTLRRNSQYPLRPHGPGKLKVGYDQDAPNRRLELFCSPECTYGAQRRRRMLETALVKIQHERETPRQPTPRRRKGDKELSAHERAEQRKPTDRELNQWQRRIEWELDALTHRPSRH